MITFYIHCFILLVCLLAFGWCCGCYGALNNDNYDGKRVSLIAIICISLFLMLLASLFALNRDFKKQRENAVIDYINNTDKFELVLDTVKIEPVIKVRVIEK